MRGVTPSPPDGVTPDPGTRAFYCGVLTSLAEAGVPFLLGDGYALAQYTGLAVIVDRFSSAMV